MNAAESTLLIDTLSNLGFSSDTLNSVFHQKLDDHDGWPNNGDVHCLTRKDLLALMAARGSGRPILLTGEPGSGKSSMARAYASLLKYDFYASMIKPGYSHESLLWQIDHVERFSVAQLPQEGYTRGHALNRREHLKLGKFRNKGVVWKAFENTKNKGTVLLLDEADKAELTLVNGLLDVLDQRSFMGPESEVVKCHTAHSLLVVITSNGDRPMPPAIIRRCAQHTLTLPVNRSKLIDYLIAIGKTKFDHLKDESVLRDAAESIADKRNTEAAVKPGISEYVDLLRVWQHIRESHGQEQADEYLAELSGFFLKQDR